MKLNQYTKYTLYWSIVWNTLNLLGYILHKDIYTFKAALTIGMLVVAISLSFKLITTSLIKLIKFIITFQLPKYIA